MEQKNWYVNVWKRDGKKSSGKKKTVFVAVFGAVCMKETIQIHILSNTLHLKILLLMREARFGLIDKN